MHILRGFKLFNRVIKLVLSRGGQLLEIQLLKKNLEGLLLEEKKLIVMRDSKRGIITIHRPTLT